jgi:hypothetical protein
MANPTQYGSFVPTTNIWDVGQFMEVDVKSKEFKELLIRLYQNVNNIALTLNIKDTGMYDTTQFVNGQLYFPNPVTPVTQTVSANYRQVYRTVVNMPIGTTLPNAGLLVLPHNITCDVRTTFTRIYGVATDPVALTYIPLPFVDAAGPNIELNVDANNVNIITTSDRTMYTTCVVVLEYLLY